MGTKEQNCETNMQQTHSMWQVGHINNATESKGKQRAYKHSGVIRE